MFHNAFKAALAATVLSSTFAAALPVDGSAYPVDGTVSYQSLEARQSVDLPAKQYVVNNYMRLPNPGRPCLFYNLAGLSNITRANILSIAAGLNAVTLYDLYYADDQTGAPFNRAIAPMITYTSAHEERDWFRYTSRIFAERCNNRVAYFLWNRNSPFYNGDSISDAWWTAIWSTDEFDAIYRGDGNAGQIQEVYIVDPDTGVAESTPAWRRGQAPPTNWRIYMAGAGAPPPSKRSVEVSEQGDSLSIEEKQHWDEVFKNTPEQLERAKQLSSLRKRGSTLADGIEQAPEQTVFSPGNYRGFVPGKCSFHFVQYTARGDPNYLFNITMYDEEQINQIGLITLQGVAGNSGYALPNLSQYTLVTVPGEHPQDPVTFKWAAESWLSNNPDYCSTGGYTNLNGGYRQGDCSFPCSVFA